MLIPALGFRAVARPGPPTATLSPKSHHAIGAWHDYSRFTMRRLILRFGTTPLERRLVPSPGDRIKPVIYCTSIRQREHTCCCQLIFWPNGLWSLQSSLRMLTYHLNLLSNPVNPKIAYVVENQPNRCYFSYPIANFAHKDRHFLWKHQIFCHFFERNSTQSYRDTEVFSRKAAHFLNNFFIISRRQATPLFLTKVPSVPPCLCV